MNYKSQEKLRLRLNRVRKRRAIKEAIPKNKMIEILKAQCQPTYADLSKLSKQLDNGHMITDTLRGMDKQCQSYINKGYTVI